MPGPRILVVDDHLDTLQLYSTFLSLEGFAVTTASCAETALRLSNNGFDAVATDLAMPGMDGAEFIRRLREAPLPPPIPIVVVTGQANGQTEAELRALGSCLLVRKPCHLPDLADLLRSVTDACAHDCNRCAVRQRAGNGFCGQ